MLSGDVLAVDKNWRIAATGDFNGDHKTDILWRHTNGALRIWNMNGQQLLSIVQQSDTPPEQSVLVQ